VGQDLRGTADPAHAREVLDADHAGLEDVKNRVVEYLAVLSSARNAASNRITAQARS
jgi:ATP-dependent Lon protease